MRRTGVMLAMAVALIFGQASGSATPDLRNAGSNVRPILDLSGYRDATVAALPGQLPQPAQAQGIGPGSHLIITMPGGTFGCTANFIWKTTQATRKKGQTTTTTRLFLGAAGHCFLPEGFTATHGPGADYNPAKTSVSVCVANCQFGGELGFEITGTLAQLGPVAYARQTQDGEDVGNDFGIVEIPSALASYVRPAMPVWGGPTTTEEITPGSIVCHYGNGVVVGETWPTMGRAGIGAFTASSEGWWAANSASTFGDSGSAVEVCTANASGIQGRGAAGILTHLGYGIGFSPAPGAGFVLGTTVAKAIQMATQANLKISLVTAN